MNCENCLYCEIDEMTGDLICTAYVDEDEMQRMSYSKSKQCPYFRNGDEYDLVRKQN